MESDGHGLRVATPRKLPRNVLDVLGNFVFLTHADPGEKHYFITYFPIHVPEVEPLQESGFGVVTYSLNCMNSIVFILLEV